MKRRSLLDRILIAVAMLVLIGPARAEPDAAGLFAAPCAECPGADQLGRLGPALLPENLGRMMGARAAAVIADGRTATQMPGFSNKLSKDEIAALAAYVSSPLPAVPSWGAAEIDASRVVHAIAPPLERPRFEADPMNLFVVVEA